MPITQTEADEILHRLQDIAELHPAAASEIALIVERLAELFGVD
jgi:hypothetical protein